MPCPYSDEDVELFGWVTLPELPENLLWDTRVDGRGTKYVSIRNASEWWIEAGERLEGDETLEAAAERCKAKFDRFQAEGPQSARSMPPVYTRRFGVQPEWHIPGC